jgi:hypothetical protein
VALRIGKSRPELVFNCGWGSFAPNVPSLTGNFAFRFGAIIVK